jgi:hypothetical protein
VTAATVRLADLVEDLTLYPRTQVSGTNVANLRAAYQAGDELPLMIVDRKSKRIIDGVHRYHMYLKELGADGSIKVDLRTYESEAEMFKAAVTANVGHGLPLQEIEKRRIVLRLQDEGSGDDEIARTLRVPVRKVEKIRLRTATVKVGGGGIRREPLKRPLFHMQGKEMTEAQVEAQRHAPGTSYLLLIRQLREGLRYRLLDFDDERLVAALEGLQQDLNNTDFGEEDVAESG